MKNSKITSSLWHFLSTWRLPMFLIGIAVLSSCSGSGRSQATHIAYPDFFVCNYWEDTNQDGLLSVPECSGIKYSYRSFESITLVGRIFGKRPQKLSYKICTADFRNVKDGGVTIMYDNYCYLSTFKPYELYNLGGGGVYKVVWYLDNNIVNITEFELRN